MGRYKTNYAKHGYFHDLEALSPKNAMLIFCKRRSGDIVKDFGHSLTHDELMARIYYQGLKDGESIFKKDSGDQGVLPATPAHSKEVAMATAICR